MDTQAFALAAAAVLAAGSYVNARYGIGTDVKEIRHEKDYARRVLEKQTSLGDTCTIYNVFSRADPTSDALWFEGRTWSYGELKYGAWTLPQYLTLVLLIKTRG